MLYGPGKGTISVPRKRSCRFIPAKLPFYMAGIEFGVLIAHFTVVFYAVLALAPTPLCRVLQAGATRDSTFAPICVAFPTQLGTRDYTVWAIFAPDC